MIMGIISLILLIGGLISYAISSDNDYDQIAIISFAVMIIGVIGVTTFIIINYDIIFSWFKI